MDSGASQHMVFDRGSFTNYEAFKDPIPIQLGNDTTIQAEGKGSIKMNLDINNEQKEGILTQVLYIPEIRKNLFSVGKVINKDLMLHFKGNDTTFYRNNKPVMTATK